MSFSSDMNDFTSGALKRFDRFRRAFTLELFNSVILDTPVDTGRARGNWQTTTGSPASGELDREGAQPATNEVLSVVSGSPIEGAVCLTNNLPYAEKLEFGSSDQAPEGMVRKNVNRALNNANSILSKVKT